MAEGIFAAFGNYDQIIGFIKMAGMFLLWLVIALILTMAIVIIIARKKDKQIVEMNMVTRKLKFMSGREKRNKSKRKQFYIGKLRKFLPMVQQEDVYLKKAKDVVFLVKDNNGLHHTARLPNMEEIIKWYKVVHEIDITAELKQVELEETIEKKQSAIMRIISTMNNMKKREALNIIGTIYLMPNPAEDLEWLADEQDQAIKQFGTGFMNKPAAIFIATLVICAFTFIISIMVTKKV